jgi:hypothetical protein
MDAIDRKLQGALTANAKQHRTVGYDAGPFD